MVENTNNTNTDSTLDFFDSVFSKVPPVFRQVDPEYLKESSKNGKKSKKQKKNKNDLKSKGKYSENNRN